MVARIEKTVFISYRRTNFPWALAIFQNLKSEGYDVFFDYLSIPSGDFENIIVENIKARAHFVVILTPSALERCNEPGDWLKREIEIAIDEKRNIVPLMLESFDFGSPSAVKALTGKLEKLKKYNSLRLHSEYFFEGMNKLREQYLNVSLDAVVHPISDAAKPVTEKHQAAASEATLVEKEQLTAQTWFERGFVFYESNNYDEAIRCYSEAIRLIPGYAGAFNNRGNIYVLTNHLDSAIEDYTRAIELDPNYAMAYCNRGLAWIDKGDLNAAIDDLDKAVQINPKYANAFINRGMAYHMKGNFNEAINDYDTAIRINPESGSAYNKRGTTREKKNDLEGALRDFGLAITYKYSEEEYLPYHNRARIHQIMGDMESALSDYNESILLNPNYSFSYYYRALIWEQRKDYRKAIADFESYLELAGGIQNYDQTDVGKKIRTLKSKLRNKKSTTKRSK